MHTQTHMHTFQSKIQGLLHFYKVSYVISNGPVTYQLQFYASGHLDVLTVEVDLHLCTCMSNKEFSVV